jgi:hypothetical protein
MGGEGLLEEREEEKRRKREEECVKESQREMRNFSSDQ